MKTHGPKSPQTVRGLRNRRSIRADLDARRFQEADLRVGEMVQPFGKGFFLVKNPGGSTPFIVKDQTGGRTFAAGSKVTLGSNTGSYGEAVFGGALAGKEGGGTVQRSRRRRGTPTADANQYAFGDNGDTFSALLYSDGSFVALRGTSLAISTSPVGCIVSDSSGFVGDGSMLGVSGNTMQVWDVEESVVYSLSAASGWILLAGPYYQNGKIYYVEGEEIEDGVTDSFHVRLRSAATDLTGSVTIQTVTRDVAGAQADLGGSTIEYFLGSEGYSAGLAVDSDGAVVYFSVRPQDGNGERTDVWQTQFRFLLADGTTTSREWSSPETTNIRAATLSGTSFVLVSLDDLEVYSKSDDASSGATIYWSAGSLDSSGFAALSVGGGGTVVQVHSDGGAGWIIRDQAVVASAVDAFDDAPTYPRAMFYFSGE